MRRASIGLALAIALSACGGTPSTSSVASRVAGVDASRCTVANAKSYDDLRSCRASPVQVELEIADDFQGKTTSKIAVTSKDPDAILAAMGAWAVEWSTGADSFTVFAYGSESDAELGGYNRGVLFWNDGGPISVDICTAFTDLEGTDFCEQRRSLTLAND